MKNGKMRCEALEEIVFSGREATPQQRQAMEEHARGCAACRALLAQEDVLRGARELDSQAEVPAAFSQRWRRAVRLTPQRQGLMRRMAGLLDGHPRGKMAVRLAAYACCAVVLVGVGAGLGGRQQDMLMATGARMRTSANSAAMVSDEDDALYETAGVAGVYTGTAGADGGAQQKRKILRTAQLDVRTGHFDDALDALRERTEALGGSVTSCDVWGEKGTVRTATLELSIPEGELDSFLAGAGALGTVTRSQSRAQDVTAAYQDNASRLESARAQKQRLDELYAQAEDMEDIVTLTDAIFSVQQEIDELEGRNRSIDARAANAQVTVSLTEEPEGAEQEQTPFARALAQRAESGLEALGSFFASLALALAWALPWLGVAAAVVLAVLLVRRWRRRR